MVRRKCRGAGEVGVCDEEGVLGGRGFVATEMGTYFV